MESRSILIFFLTCLAAETICNAEEWTNPASDSTIAASQPKQHWTYAHAPEVHPDMYGDHDTHFYVRWIGDNYTECFHHHHCPGFIATNTSQLTLGSKLNPSVIGRSISVLQLALTQDKSSGVWYLHGGPYLPVLGYWNRDHFASLTGVVGAVVACFGGEVFTPEDSDWSPPMSSGLFKNSNYAVTGYIDDIKVNSGNPIRDYIDVVETRCYFVSEVPGLVPNGFGFFFGGGGGMDQKNCTY